MYVLGTVCCQHIHLSRIRRWVLSVICVQNAGNASSEENRLGTFLLLNAFWSLEVVFQLRIKIKASYELISRMEELSKKVVGLQKSDDLESANFSLNLKSESIFKISLRVISAESQTVEANCVDTLHQ